jgi:pimeloyl-ACP methyl ester carboxylesterase
MPQIVIDGLLTNYQVLGDKKEVLLILPGWKRSSNEWMPVAKDMSDQYKVVVLDLPGFGGVTAMPKEVFGVFEYAEFVKKFLEKLKINNCTLLGHSFGGRIGIVLASEDKIVNKLILVDSAGIENKSLYASVMRAAKKLFSPVFMALPPTLKNKIGNLIGSADYKTSGEMRKIFVKTVNQNLRPLLSKINVQAFIIWGDKDRSLSVSQTKTFKKEINDSKVRIVWGAGHDPHLEKYGQFLAILKDIV